MLGLILKEKHSNGESRLEIWRDEGGLLAMTVYDVSGGPQFDFELTDFEAKEFIHLMDLAFWQKPGEAV